MKIPKYVLDLGLCPESLEYVAGQRSLQAAWDNCDRGDWMLLLLEKLSGPVGSESRKKLVLVCCACARLSLKYVKQGEERPRIAIETAEAYAKGEGKTLEDVRKAAYAFAASTAAFAAAPSAAFADAAFAFAAAAFAAFAAFAAAFATASTASNAAASTASNAAKKDTLRECASIVRTMYPECPIGKKEKPQ